MLLYYLSGDCHTIYLWWYWHIQWPYPTRFLNLLPKFSLAVPILILYWTYFSHYFFVTRVVWKSSRVVDPGSHRCGQWRDGPGNRCGPPFLHCLDSLHGNISQEWTIPDLYRYLYDELQSIE